MVVIDFKELSDGRYQLTRTFIIQTDIHPPLTVFSDYIRLQPEGTLIIERGYCWDGATGGFDTPDFMRGSLAHDGLCDLIARGLLDKSYRPQVDKLLRNILIEDGMSKLRAWWIYTFIKYYVKIKY